jgi:hypothetical protein
MVSTRDAQWVAKSLFPITDTVNANREFGLISQLDASQRLSAVIENGSGIRGKRS